MVWPRARHGCFGTFNFGWGARERRREEGRESPANAREGEGKELGVRDVRVDWEDCMLAEGPAVCAGLLTWLSQTNYTLLFFVRSKD